MPTAGGFARVPATVRRRRRSLRKGRLAGGWIGAPAEEEVGMRGLSLKRFGLGRAVIRTVVAGTALHHETVAIVVDDEAARKAEEDGILVIMDN